MTIAIVGGENSVNITLTRAIKVIHLYEGPNVIEYRGSSGKFPDVLTNIGPAGLNVAEIVWLRDESTGGEWWFYNVAQNFSSPAQFTGMVKGKVYIVVVSQECDWIVLSVTEIV